MAEETGKISISDGIVIAALPVFAYIIHYFFEFGYLSYFDIPAAFISFNLSEMIPAVFIVVIIYFLFTVILWPYISFFLGRLPGFVKALLLLFPWLIIFILLRFSWDIILFILFIILLVLGVELLQRFSLKRAAEKEKKTPSSILVNTQSSFDMWVSKIIPNGNRFTLFYVLFFALICSVGFGRFIAVTRTTYPIADSSPGCAVVYTTSDRYICKPFTNKEVGATFKIFYLQESQNIEFRYENIGPLIPKPLYD